MVVSHAFSPLKVVRANAEAREHSRSMLRPQFTRGQISDLELEETHVQALIKSIPSASGSWTATVDLAPLFFHLTLDSATEFLLGESVCSQSTTNEMLKKSSAPDWSSFGRYFDVANVAVSFRLRLFDLYFLYNPRSFRDSCREVHKCVDHFVNLALSGEKIGSKENRYVFLQELVNVTRDPIELRSQLLNVLLAGRDTTAGLLSWTFYMLARHPEVFDRLRTAILDHFGTGIDLITFESLKSCTYLQHVMSEVLRFEPLVPENDRRAVRNTTLPRGGGPDGQSPIYIREGQEVLFNTRIMHRRKDIWGEDANEFKPVRWLGRRMGWEYLPFSGGPRICLGQQFALTEAGYVIVRILQRYDKLENLDEAPMKHKYTSTSSPVAVLVLLHETS